MATHTISSPTTATNPARTARLLRAGIAAGPVFLGTSALQAFTRAGFDPTRHPISLLALGDLGWIQIGNFVVTGALCIASSIGVRRALGGGTGGTWGPRLIAAMGAGLIAAGVFVTDAGAGYPAGAPAGAPQMSWHGALHEAGHALTMISWTAACMVLRRRFAAAADTALARLSVAALIAAWGIVAVPHLDSLSLRLGATTAVQFGYLALVAVRLLRPPADRSKP